MKVKVDYEAKLYATITVDIPDGLAGQAFNYAVEEAAYKQLDVDLYQIGTVGVSNYYTEQEALEYEND